jgi:hypothetical protein
VPAFARHVFQVFYVPMGPPINLPRKGSRPIVLLSATRMAPPFPAKRPPARFMARPHAIDSHSQQAQNDK